MFIGHFDDIINKEFFILFDVVSVVQKTRIYGTMTTFLFDIFLVVILFSLLII